MTGASATGAWIAGDTAVFAAGTDAINAYTVTLGAAQTAAGLTVEEGTVSLAGSALTIGAGTIRIESGAKLIIGFQVRRIEIIQMHLPVTVR